jgi:lipopolysaccharide export system permease protein
MPLFSRYILGEYLKYLGMFLALFLLVFFTIHFMEKIRLFSQAGAPLFWIAQHFLLKIPWMISDLMPLSVLLATLMTLGALSKNNEVVPIMNAGVGILGLAAPLLVVGGLVSLLFFFFNGSVVPSTLKRARMIQQDQIERKGGATLVQNKIWFRLNGKTLLYTQLVNSEENTMYGVHLYYLGDTMPITQEIEAQMLRYEGREWVLYRGTRLQYQPDGTLLRIPFARERISISKTLSDIQQMAVEPKEMTTAGLSAYIDQLKRDGLNAVPYQVALHSKRALPFASVILVLLGIPISFSYLRKGGMTRSVILGMGIILLYWLVLSVAAALGRLEVVPPVIAGWGPHFLFLLLGMGLFANLHRVRA